VNRLKALPYTGKTNIIKQAIPRGFVISGSDRWQQLMMGIQGNHVTSVWPTQQESWQPSNWYRHATACHVTLTKLVRRQLIIASRDVLGGANQEATEQDLLRCMTGRRLYVQFLQARNLVILILQSFTFVVVDLMLCVTF